VLTVELVDAQAWAYLSLYFAEKLRSAVAYKRFLDDGAPDQGRKAVQSLRKAVGHWEALAAATEPVYVEMPLANIYRFEGETAVAGEDTRTFHWKKLLPAVVAELNRLQEAVDKDGKVLLRKTGIIDPLEVDKKILDVLGTTY
jgi:hypothetical protein